MFKSSENLRLAADMRALQRVAAPWREARTTWFDGTPESIEARMASTDKVLAQARSGFTAAHLALTAEAEKARRELLAAKHRLLTDFLDDGARAFKGSKRVAGPEDWVIDISSNGGETGSSTSLRHRDDKENNRFTLQRPEGYSDRARVITNHDDTEMMSPDGMHHWASRRVTADESTGFGNAEWQARQESELDPEMRGNYYDGPDTGECRHCGERIEERGEGGYGHVLGIHPYTGDTTFYPSDHPAEPDDDEYHTARRTAATLPDFDDQLLFDS